MLSPALDTFSLLLRYTDKSNLREKYLFQRIVYHHVWEGVAVGRGGVAVGWEAWQQAGKTNGRGRRLAGHMASTLRNQKEKEVLHLGVLSLLT